MKKGPDWMKKGSNPIKKAPDLTTKDNEENFCLKRNLALNGQ